MQAIETVYKGYRFRSRLEARWAVFFDAMNIEWQYEVEGYKLKDGTLYLPDFFFPEWNIHGEVKGRPVEYSDLNKIFQFCVEDKHLLIFNSYPMSPDFGSGGIIHYSEFCLRRYWSVNLKFEGLILSSSKDCFIAKCEYCGKNVLISTEDYKGIYYQISDCCERFYEHADDGLDLVRLGAPRLVNSLNSAKSARFEHGEHGGR